MARFKRPVVFSIDCSRWDKHVTSEVLKIEHEFYQSFYHGDEFLKHLLKMQVKNKCCTKNGVRYQVHGGRMSGDINTALGNCFLMVVMAEAALRKIGVTHDLLDDGDDCLVFSEEEDFEKIEKDLPAIFLTYGQELKVENIARKPEAVVFCQSRMVWNGETWTMVRPWQKILSQTCCGTKYWNMPNMVRPMLGLVGACESYLSRGVPILSVFARALHRLSQGEMAKITCAESGLALKYKLESGNAEQPTYIDSNITPAARLSFEETWGVPLWQQFAIERRLDQWTLETTDAKTVPIELDYQWRPNYSVRAFIPEVF